MIPSAPAPALSAMEDSFRPRVPAGLIVDETPRAVFLLHPTQPRWAITNKSGLQLAQWFDGSTSLAEAARRMASIYGAAADVSFLSDVRAFAAQLHGANLIENLPAADEPRQPTTREPHRLTIYLTEECNLRCKHCFVVEGKMAAPRITADDVRGLVDEHIALHPRAMVAFTGGEALLRDDCLDLMEYARSKTPFINVNTNGLLIDEAAARRLAAMRVGIQVSLDGADPEVHDFVRGKGTYAKTWAAIRLLCDAGAARRVRIATTLTKCAVAQVRELVAQAEALSLLECRFLILNKLKAAITHWDRIAPDPAELLDVYRFLLIDLPRSGRKSSTAIQGEFPGFVPYPDPNGHHWCPIGETTIVDSQGNTYGCPSLLVPEYRTGSIYDSSIDEIQNGENHRKLREIMLSRRYAIPECKACAWRNFCQGGCQAFTQLRTGSEWVMDEYCDFRRELYRTHALLDAEHGPAFHGPAC